MREILHKSRILTYRKEGEGFEPILVHQNVVPIGQISLKVTPNLNWYKCLDDRMPQ